MKRRRVLRWYLVVLARVRSVERRCLRFWAMTRSVFVMSWEGEADVETEATRASSMATVMAVRPSIVLLGCA